MSIVIQLTLKLSHKKILLDLTRTSNPTTVFLGNLNPPEKLHIDYQDGRIQDTFTSGRDEAVPLVPLSDLNVLITIEKEGFIARTANVDVAGKIDPPDLSPRILLPIDLRIRENDTGLIFDVNTSSNTKILQQNDHIWEVYFDDSGQNGFKDWSMNDLAFILNQKSDTEFRIDIFQANSTKSLDLLFGDQIIKGSVGAGTFSKLGETVTVTTTERKMEFECSQLAGANLPIIGPIIVSLCSIFKPLVDMLSMRIDEARTSFLETLNNSLLVNAINNIQNSIKALETFFSNPLKFIIDSISTSSNLFDDYNAIARGTYEQIGNSFDPDKFQTDEFKLIATDVRNKLTSSPITAEEIVQVLQDFAVKPVSTVINRILLPAGVLTFNEAQSFSSNYIGLAFDVVVLVVTFQVVSSLLPRALRVFDSWVDSLTLVGSFLGAGAVTAKFLDPAFQAALIRPLEQGYNERFPTQIPDTNELINERVKEVIDVDIFEADLAKKGFAKERAERIFQAHFDEPEIEDVVNALNRGFPVVAAGVDSVDSFMQNELKLSSETIADIKRELAILDFQPKANNLWLQRFFRDPSRTEARLMFETGAIGEAEIKDILRRNRLLPRDVDRLTLFITRFQERVFRRQYLLALRRAYELGVITLDKLTAEVLAANFSQGVVDWIVKRADVNKLILASKKDVLTERTLSLSILDDLFTDDLIGESEIELELIASNYTPARVSKITELFRARKAAKEPGVPTVRELSVSTILRLLKLKLITNDQAVARIMVLRYKADDANLLVNLVQEKRIEERFKLLPVGTILRLMKVGEISLDVARNKLREHGFNENDITLLVDSKLFRAAVGGV